MINANQEWFIQTEIAKEVIKFDKKFEVISMDDESSVIK